MKELEYYQKQLQFEQGNRTMNLIAGVGFIGLAGVGIRALAKGKELGIIPLVVGAGLALNEFHEASITNTDIKFIRSKITTIESSQLRRNTVQ